MPDRTDQQRIKDLERAIGDLTRLIYSQQLTLDALCERLHQRELISEHEDRLNA